MESSAEVCALVIDDHADVRELIAEILLADGHVVVCAESGEEGLSYLPHYTFEVAFLDHKLPGIEGFALGEYLRRNNPHMQIALVTAEVDEALERLCRDHHISFIAKPFRVGDISNQVSAYLSCARERQARERDAHDEDYAVDWCQWADELSAFYAMPSVPSRLETQLVRRLGDAMVNLRAPARYTERDRALALAGLLCAELLGLRLPRGPGGRSLAQEYDRIMSERGRKPAFGSSEEP